MMPEIIAEKTNGGDLLPDTNWYNNKNNEHSGKLVTLYVLFQWK